MQMVKNIEENKKKIEEANKELNVKREEYLQGLK